MQSSLFLMNPSNGSCFNALKLTFTPIDLGSKTKGGSEI